MGHLMNRAARLFRQLADQRLEPLGLSSGQMPVLTALLAKKEMSQKELTEHAGIEQPTMAATLNRMERDALIQRQTDPHDRRSSLFSLTAAARAKAQAIRAVVQSINEDALAHLASEDQVRFRALIGSVIVSMEKTTQSPEERSS